jgi:hypothetical protein
LTPAIFRLNTFPPPLTAAGENLIYLYHRWHHLWRIFSASFEQMKLFV